MKRGARSAAALSIALIAGCSTERATGPSAAPTGPVTEAPAITAPAGSATPDTVIGGTLLDTSPPGTSPLGTGTSVSTAPSAPTPGSEAAVPGSAVEVFGSLPPASLPTQPSPVPGITISSARPAGSDPTGSSPGPGSTPGSSRPTASTSTTGTTPSPASSPPVGQPQISLPQTTVFPGANESPSITDGERTVFKDFSDRAKSLFAASDGVGLAISHNGALVGSYLIGKDVRGGSLDQFSRFRLASISKLITAITVLRLAEDGLIDIDKPVVDYWTPDKVTDPMFNSVTIRQLLSHGSGVQKLRDTFFGQDIPWQKTAERAAAASLTDAPGTKFNYSNANFTVLGALIEQVTGERYERVVDRLVLTPMGITTATFMKTNADPVSDPVYFTGANRHYMEALGPAGAWVMSPEDLARLVGLRTPEGTTLLKPETDKLRRTPSGLDTRDTDWRYGLGLMIFASAWGHTGTIESARTFALTFPNGYSVSVLTSTQAVGTGEQLIQQFLPQIAELAGLPAS